jgi:hypothetical protein
MPKAPILHRTRFVDVLRDGTQIFLDWNLVNTSLGAMMEPVSMAHAPGQLQQTTQGDPYDVSFNALLPMSRDALFSITNSGGELFPRTYNTQ